MGWRLRQLARRLERGALIACQTDTIWGFSCHPLRITAIKRLLELKQRPSGKGLILIGGDIEQFRPFLSDRGLQALRRGMDTSAPRPTTWVVPAAIDCPPWLSPDGKILAIRITRHPIVQELCDHLGSPLITTSANRSGMPAARNRYLVERRFGRQLDAVIGPHRGSEGQPSRIIDLQSGRILRP